MNSRHIFRPRSNWSRRLWVWVIPLLLVFVAWPAKKNPEKSPETIWLPPVELIENIRVTPKNLDKNSPPVSDESALRQAITRWSQTWSARDVPGYLSLYSPDFVPPKGMNRQRWAELRGERISGKEKITLTVQNLKVKINESKAVVKFTQVYTDERLRRLDQKTMVWQKSDGQWLIQSETTD